LSKTRALRHHYVLPVHMLFILHCTGNVQNGLALIHAVSWLTALVN